MNAPDAVAGSTECDGVLFTEDPLPAARRLGRESVEISRQNANLYLVKQELASRARVRGGNCIANFRYGQRAHSWLQLISLKWDTESWYGSGDVVDLPRDGASSIPPTDRGPR